MNTENIAALSAMLVRSGFDESIGYRLMQRICFHPASFTLIERMQRGHDILTCALHFERRGVEYDCGYYDVGLLRGIAMPDRVVSGINLPELDAAMGGIEWSSQDGGADFRLGDPLTWERE
jgi:hypothetical protein